MGEEEGSKMEKGFILVDRGVMEEPDTGPEDDDEAEDDDDEDEEGADGIVLC